MQEAGGAGQDRGPGASLPVETAHEDVGQRREEGPMLLGHVVADDPSSDPLGECPSAGALLNGHLARVIGRTVPSPTTRVIQHGSAFLCHRAATAAAVMGTKPGRASIRPIQAWMAA